MAASVRGPYDCMEKTAVDYDTHDKKSKSPRSKPEGYDNYVKESPAVEVAMVVSNVNDGGALVQACQDRQEACVRKRTVPSPPRPSTSREGRKRKWSSSNPDDVDVGESADRPSTISVSDDLDVGDFEKSPSPSTSLASSSSPSSIASDASSIAEDSADQTSTDSEKGKGEEVSVPECGSYWIRKHSELIGLQYLPASMPYMIGVINTHLFSNIPQEKYRNFRRLTKINQQMLRSLTTLTQSEPSYLADVRDEDLNKLAGILARFSVTYEGLRKKNEEELQNLKDTMDELIGFLGEYFNTNEDISLSMQWPSFRDLSIRDFCEKLIRFVRGIQGLAAEDSSEDDCKEVLRAFASIFQTDFKSEDSKSREQTKFIVAGTKVTARPDLISLSDKYSDIVMIVEVKKYMKGSDWKRDEIKTRSKSSLEYGEIDTRSESSLELVPGRSNLKPYRNRFTPTLKYDRKVSFPHSSRFVTPVDERLQGQHAAELMAALPHNIFSRCHSTSENILSLGLILEGTKVRYTILDVIGTWHDELSQRHFCSNRHRGMIFFTEPLDMLNKDDWPQFLLMFSTIQALKRF